MNRSVLIAAGITLAAAAWIGSGVFARETPAPQVAPVELPLPKVRVFTSHSQTRTATLALHGQTQAKQVVSLRAETGGQVASLAVSKGQRVEQGQELLRLTLKERPARVAEARAKVEQMRLAYQQATSLAQKSFASQTTVAQAKANLENAQAALAVVQQDVADTVIRAPFAGVFDQNLVEVGDYVTPGGVVGTLLNLDPLTVIAEVSERNRADVVAGSVTPVTLLNSATYAGTTTWISQIANPVTRTYKVEITLPNADFSIPSGMTVRADIPMRAEQAHLISPAILALNDKGQIGIKALDDQDRVIFYPVVPEGDGQSGMWVSGLPESLRLIAVGQEYVRTGGKAIAVPLPPEEIERAVQQGAGQ